MYSIVGQQADEVVLVRPDIPIGVGELAEPLPRQVGAKVSVGLLALDQLGGGAIEFLAQALISRVGPGERGGVHPLADVFADPRVAARFLVVSGQERFGVDEEKPMALIGVDPAPSQPPMWMAEGESRSSASAKAAAALGGAGSAEPARPAASTEAMVNIANRRKNLVHMNSLRHVMV